MARSSVTVCIGLRDGMVSTARPASMSSCTDATTNRTPDSATSSSRVAITSSKLWPVSTCITGNGSRPGRNALSARCSMTMESLPPENNSTGRSNSAATSRMMWIASASSERRWLSSYWPAAGPAFTTAVIASLVVFLINLVELTIFMVIATYGTSRPRRCQSSVAQPPNIGRITPGAAAAPSRRPAGAKAWTHDHRSAERPRRHRGVPPQSPFVAKLGIVADQLRDDEVRLRLPWDPSNVTIGDMVHGGAIATLADLTVMAAAWCGADAPRNCGV